MKHLFCPRNTLLTFLSAVGLAAGALAGDFAVRDGDRVVFLGDSITEQRLYTTYIEAYALTRHPEWKLTFRNVGWGGDTSWLRQRSHPDERALFEADAASQQRMVEDAVGRGLRRDVLPLNPTLVTVDFAMNDHSYQAFRPDIFAAYVRSQEQIAKVLQTDGCRVAFLTTQPIEDKRSDPDKDVRNQSLRKFSDGLKTVAAGAGALFVDQFDPYMAMLVREREGNPPRFIGGGDAVHPGPIGHTVMAWAILKGLDAPALVSAVEINGAAGKLQTAQGCRVENVKLSEGTISFDRSDEALPMPINPKAEPALKLAPILHDLSRYGLQVTSLAPGRYEVAIDGQTVAKLSSEELAKGCNLTITAGPITEQARQVLNLVVKKNDLFFNRWRNVQLYSFPAWAQGPEIPEFDARRSAEIARLDQQIADQEARIDEVRRPKPHHFTVKPAAQ